jgi:hypothetical protein
MRTLARVETAFTGFPMVSSKGVGQKRLSIDADLDAVPRDPTLIS